MHQELPTINGELLRLRREARGWALSDLATRACMSIKQIRQLEEGGSSAFYNETIKWTSAKKVGSLLGMEPDEVFVQTAVEITSEKAPETSSQPPVDVVETSSVEPSPATTSEVETQVVTDTNTNADTSVNASTSTDAAQNSKTPVLALAALFVAALAVAAWMRPEPEVVAEPAPPVLQNIATEPADAASTSVASASAATVTASAASAATQAQKPASTALAVTPAASATVAKPAAAVQAPASTASAASKPL